VESGILDLKKISMVLNLDILGSGEEGITVVNGSVFPQFYHRLVQLNESIPAVPVVKPRGKAANSDHYPFSEKGVPSLFVYTMGPNKNYHDIHDRYENLSFDRFESLHYLFVRFLNRF
jgi:Zn-dependent M28 family amino/carboxypeptidase